MMYCGKCGAKIEDETQGCLQCDGVASGAEGYAQAPASHGGRRKRLGVNAYTLNDNEMQRLSSSFISSDERLIAVLGGLDFKNFLAGHGLSTEFSFFTDKRFYFKRNSRNIIVRLNAEESIIDIKDVTGSGYRYESHIWRLVLGIFHIFLALISVFLFYPLAVLFGLCGLVLIVMHVLYGRRTNFYIEYPGGSIDFEVSQYSMSEVDDFHKLFRQTMALSETSWDEKFG